MTCQISERMCLCVCARNLHSVNTFIQSVCQPAVRLNLASCRLLAIVCSGGALVNTTSTTRGNKDKKARKRKETQISPEDKLLCTEFVRWFAEAAEEIVICTTVPLSLSPRSFSLSLHLRHCKQVKCAPHVQTGIQQKSSSRNWAKKTFKKPLHRRRVEANALSNSVST